MTQRVLVARLDSMGDVLLTGPAVRAIARQAEVIYLSSSRGAEAARLLPGVSEHLVWDAPWVSTTTLSASGGTVFSDHLESLRSMVREAHAQQAVIFTSFHQSPLPLALMLRQADVPHITGASVDTPGSLLDTRLIPGESLAEDIPEPVRAIEIARAAGFSSHDDGRLRVVGLSDTVPRLPTAPFVALHPGADAPARMWPVDRFVQAAELLVAHGYGVVLTGSASERSLTATIAHSVPEAVDLAGECTLAQLGTVLQRAEVLVAGNTGPAHLAAAVGTPVVSLFAPVVPAVKWAPYGVAYELLGDQRAPCRDTRATTCPIEGHPCLNEVTGSRVLRAVQTLTRSSPLRRKEPAQ